MKHPFSQRIPPWTDGRNQRNLFLVCSGGALVLMALLLPAYYGLYLLTTPETCLRPGQLARLQALFHGLFLPTPHPGWG